MSQPEEERYFTRGPYKPAVEAHNRMVERVKRRSAGLPIEEEKRLTPEEAEKLAAEIIAALRASRDRVIAKRQAESSESSE